MSSAEPSARTAPVRLWRWPGTEWEWLLAGVLAALLLLVGVAILRSGPGADTRAVQLHNQGVQTDARVTRIETTGPGGPRVSNQFTAASGQVVKADDQRPGASTPSARRCRWCTTLMTRGRSPSAAAPMWTRQSRCGSSSVG